MGIKVSGQDAPECCAGCAVHREKGGGEMRPNPPALHLRTWHLGAGPDPPEEEPLSPACIVTSAAPKLVSLASQAYLPRVSN